MSAGMQLAMNPGLLRSGQYSLKGGAQFQGRLGQAPLGNNNVLSISSDNAQCSVDFHLGAHAAQQLKVAPSSVKPYRFLPYRENRASWIKLGREDDQGAQLVLTGPLTGCSVFLARKDAATVLLHVNSNENAAGDRASPQAHLNLLDAALASAGMARENVIGAAVQYAEGPFNTYAAYGERESMVIGCRPKAGLSLKSTSWTGSLGAKDWRFYLYGWGVAGTVFTEL